MNERTRPFQTGAVDYVEKSRSFAILRKRIDLIRGARKGPAAAVVRAPAAVPLSVGSLEISPAEGKVLWRGADVGLTLTEFQMVRYMAERVGTNVRYRELYDLVHGRGFLAGEGGEGYRANVRTFMKRIRQKFRDVDEHFAEIENYPGFGYRWRKDGA